MIIDNTVRKDIGLRSVVDEIMQHSRPCISEYVSKRI